MIRKRRKVFWAFFTGVILAFCYIAGANLDMEDTFNLSSISFYLKWLLGSAIATVLLLGIWEIAIKIDEYLSHSKKLENFDLPYWVYVIIIFLCWIPVLLSIFPAAFSYDAHQQWQEIRSWNISSHHPVLHTLIVGGCVEGFYHLTGSYNVGIAVYTIVQMLIMANVCAYTIKFLKSYKINGVLQICSLAFYCLSPVMQLFAINCTKDVLFTGASLLFFLFTIDLCCRREEFFNSKKKQAGFVLSAFFTGTLRNNGLYVVIIITILLAFLCRNYLKKYILLMLFMLLPYLVYIGPIYAMVGITKGGVQEMLSVPIQQMTRTYHYNKEELLEEEIELLYQLIPQEYLELYKPTVSDPVKTGFQQEVFKNHIAKYGRLWMEWGIKYPVTYIKSFLLNTSDFWYPNAVVDGYKKLPGKSDYFDYQVDEPGTEIILLPKFHEYYEKISSDAETSQKPFMFLILSPGWYFWIFLIVFSYIICYKKKQLIMPLMIVLLSWLTVLLGPMALVRYVLILFYAFPVFISMFVQTSRFMSIVSPES